MSYICDVLAMANIMSETSQTSKTWRFLNNDLVVA